MATVRSVRRDAGDDPLTMLTAYDAPTARVVDDAGVDLILVGDSIGNAKLGYETTLPVTLDEIASATGAVARAAEAAVVVADMPFLSYGADEADSVQNCGRMLKEADADAVKLECGPHTVDLTDRLTNLGIPVMAHLGLTPQHVNQLGGFHRQGTDQDAAGRMLELAREHEAAGAFSLVLEHVPGNVAADITDALAVPTVGIGAGPDTDGQVLVVDDVLGLSEHSPPFSEQFGDVQAEMERAVGDYVAAVESGDFPGDEHTHVAENVDDLY
jgi:3-methyl-2-oxobutanoate hydroxymethyltransferase